MLGLSGGITGTTKADRILKSEFYTFESSVSPWIVSSVEGTLTMQAGQSAPGSSDSDWMKCTYDTNQTSVSGIRVVSWASGIIAVDDVLTVTCDLHLVDDSGKWGTDPPINFRAQIGGAIGTSAVALDTTSINHTFTVTAASTANQLLIEVHTPADRPQAGGVFYIRNIRATLKRP
tara:strand:+ start:461 stop:988 length:528 start_codon:yes stop_codon:yes gene_type:complete